MKLDDFDPAAIAVEDQRLYQVETPKWWDIVAHGVQRNWNENGVRGLLGMPPVMVSRNFAGVPLLIDENQLAQSKGAPDVARIDGLTALATALARGPMRRE